MILYKYKTINDNTIDALKKNQIFYPYPDSLNDPFDCKAEIFADSFGLNAEELINTQIVTSFIHYHMNTNSSYLSEFKKKQLLNELSKTKNSKAAVKRIEQFYHAIGMKDYSLYTLKERYKDFSKQINKLGVLSLTEDPANMLMWSHYGDQHKGIVLGIEIDESIPCKKCIYDDTFPILDMNELNVSVNWNISPSNDGLNVKRKSEIDFNNPILQEILFRKAKCWEYEKEYRIIEHEYGLHNYPGKLVEIIFGCRCEPSDILPIKRIVEKDVKFKTIETKDNSFELCIK